MVISTPAAQSSSSALHYQVGGSLRKNSNTYIQRRADDALYKTLLGGEYCYLFNARQMGKSSLRVRMQQRLTEIGKRCASVDMTSIGSEQVTPLQWYKGLMVDLLSKFELTGQVDFKQWWSSKSELSMVQRLRLFIEEILLRSRPDEDLYIFVDEIDSALALNFPIDDFFALIRFCYNQRSENPAYQRLTWSLFGVVMPSELIRDSRRTPFNVGRAIELKGLVFEDAQVLAEGLAGYEYDPLLLLKEILAWTNGQPFLTQKLCQLTAEALAKLPSKSISDHAQTAQNSKDNESSEAQETDECTVDECTVDDCTVIDVVTETLSASAAADGSTKARALVDSVVYTRIIDHWESQDDPEHLRTIRDRILRQELQAPRLLGIYQTILASNIPLCEISIAANQQDANRQTEEERRLTYDDSPEHLELLLSGVIGLYQGRLAVKNRIYETIFDLAWVSEQLASLRPYAKQLLAWVASDRTDESRLLRGKALKDAQAWSQERSVGEVDHDFLMASERYDRRVVQQSMKFARLKEIEKRLVLERRVRRRQRVWIGSLSSALAFVVVLSGIAWWQSQRAQQSQLKAMITSAEALYSSDQRLDALLQSVKAERVFDKNWQSNGDSVLSQRLTAILRTAAVSVVERNRLILEDSNFWDVDIHHSGDYLATASADYKVRLWSATGEQLA
ncbi:MAG: AAA-like domain-containing protein, partial [Cyanobacteria bacterium J06627_28]